MNFIEHVSQYAEAWWVNFKFVLIYLNIHLELCYGIIFVLLVFLGIAIYNRAASVATPNAINDLTAIAGDDMVATQLDLATAYIEMDQKVTAEEILQRVIQHGDQIQQQKARQLINSL